MNTIIDNFDNLNKYEKNQFSFILGQKLILSNEDQETKLSKKEEDEKVNSPYDSGSTSDDYSSQEENENAGSCQLLRDMFKVNEGKTENFQINSRVGLNGSQLHESFYSIMDAEKKKFFIWLGNITIDKFTKSTFMNLADFAENKEAQSMVFVQFRNHQQKSKIALSNLNRMLDEFKKLFKVLDAKRVSMKGMKSLFEEKAYRENVEKYALYEVALN